MKASTRKALRAPILFLIILLFVAIFLVGSVTDSYVGEGIYLASVPSNDGTQYLNTIIRFDDNEGSRQTFSMFNFIASSGDADAVPDSITKTLLDYTGLYYKELFPTFYLRPNGLHFPIFTFEPGDKLTIDWSVADLVSLDAEGNPLEQEWKNISHRSQVNINGDVFRFDNLDYHRLDTVPENYQQWMDMLDQAMDAKNAK